MSSILNDIKNMLGIVTAETHFDGQLIIYINTAISILRQAGVGPVAGYSITGDSETWSNYINDMSKLEPVKTYIYMKVRMMFDPPSGAVKESMNAILEELIWRLNTEVDPVTTYD